ncbi:MAG: hypothetical protein IJN77_07540 [Oscillospiraceae bacterium]|nr:hypothetical protein [Oscillospiraceae bacterium]MBQ6850873.1 hypothetical protein [Oscillospiraceae bacterium]
MQLKTDFSSIYTVLLPIKPIGNYKGFQQLVSIIEKILEQGKLQYNLSHDIYPYVAGIYDCKENSIERNIRTLLLNMDIKSLKKLTGQNIQNEITVSQLIDILVTYILFKHI